MKLSVIVPAYNEETTIREILGSLLKLDSLLKEIIVVDDDSTDKTADLVAEFAIKKPIIKLIKLQKNSGKTSAVKKGVEIATGEIIIIQDADLEYDPEEIPDVVLPILEGVADVVYGSRFMVKKRTRVLYFYHYLANKFLTFISNCLTNLNMTDIETCYKAFKRPIIQEMMISSKRFGMEVEITAKIARLGIRIFEVPISYHGRTYEEGKKISYKDGLWAIFYIIYFNLLVRISPSYKRYRSLVREAIRNESY